MRLACFALLALAGATPVGASGMDVDSLCLDCHRPTQTRGEVPLIEGQQAGYLRRRLVDFRDRHDSGFPMSGLSSGLVDIDVEAIAATLSTRQWRRAARPVSRSAAERGRMALEPGGCRSCHGEGFQGEDAIPRLAGQQPGYLRRQIRAFAEGSRRHPLSEVDAGIYALDDAQMRDIAAYLHSLP